MARRTVWLLAVIACLTAAALLLAFWLVQKDGLDGSDLYFIREGTNMQAEKRIRNVPMNQLFGGGGENVPGDRETRATVYNAEREGKNAHETV